MRAQKGQDVGQLRKPQVQRHLDETQDVPRDVDAAVAVLAVAERDAKVDAGGNQVEGGGDHHGAQAVGVLADLVRHDAVLEGQEEAGDAEEQRHGPVDRLDLLVRVEARAHLGKAHHDAQVQRLA